MNLFGEGSPESPLFSHTFHVDVQEHSLLHHYLKAIMTALEQLQSDVAASAAIQASAVSLLALLASKGVDDSAALAALSATIQKQNADMQDAITANTPVTPPPAV